MLRLLSTIATIQFDRPGASQFSYVSLRLGNRVTFRELERQWDRCGAGNRELDDHYSAQRLAN